MKDSWALVSPKIIPPLDAAFRPATLARQAFRERAASNPVRIQVALERSSDSISRCEMLVAKDAADTETNFFFVERWLKFLLWSRGGWRLHFSGPSALAERLRRHYRESATGPFDAWIVRKVYERDFEIISCSDTELPAPCESAARLGRHWEGCRIGFDLGASDRKVAAVQEGRVVFTEEVPWDPRAQSDPQWHFDEIMDSLKRAASRLPRVDAIGGSSAGVFVNNRVQVASLFRGVPEELFNTRVKNLFLDIQRAWNGIPVEVVNDGEVTALAGAMSINDNAVLGVAMGSSEAAGYVTPDGNITPWLNELAFAPVDYSPLAPVDEWSGDRGCGVQYFSQQGVGRLVKPSGLEINDALPLPEKLVAVQKRMAAGDERAAKIYETIGVYLGYAIAHYAEFYDFRHLLLLGRVTTGDGASVMVREAQRVLREEFPSLGARTMLHLPHEKEKRHGQAMAAASLPRFIPG